MSKNQNTTLKIKIKKLKKNKIKIPIFSVHKRRCRLRPTAWSAARRPSLRSGAQCPECSATDGRKPVSAATANGCCRWIAKEVAGEECRNYCWFFCFGWKGTEDGTDRGSAAHEDEGGSAQHLGWIWDTKRGLNLNLEKFEKNHIKFWINSNALFVC